MVLTSGLVGGPLAWLPANMAAVICPVGGKTAKTEADNLVEASPWQKKNPIWFPITNEY
jgi:hypothetical protein